MSQGKNLAALRLIDDGAERASLVRVEGSAERPRAGGGAVTSRSARNGAEFKARARVHRREATAAVLERMAWGSPATTPPCEAGFPTTRRRDRSRLARNSSSSLARRCTRARASSCSSGGRDSVGARRQRRPRTWLVSRRRRAAEAASVAVHSVAVVVGDGGGDVGGGEAEVGEEDDGGVWPRRRFEV
ncbi:hypothetical protein OsI_01775 [Oryza sativa Indica Group]|uniref:Uncharacterized protein n=1 Tax=Oryza sativa subsp. indica TaxID=39946 RepID=A2WPJ6_ORYSI|nr:hypothetical protein OsI_01775 [Oryza sativa Indica Group]